MRTIALTMFGSLALAGCGAGAATETEANVAEVVPTPTPTAVDPEQQWCERDAAITGLAAARMNSTVSYMALAEGRRAIESSVAYAIEQNGGRKWTTKWNNGNCEVHFRFQGIVEGNSYSAQGRCIAKIGPDTEGQKAIVELKDCTSF